MGMRQLGLVLATLGCCSSMLISCGSRNSISSLDPGSLDSDQPSSDGSTLAIPNVPAAGMLQIQIEADGRAVPDQIQIQSATFKTIPGQGPIHTYRAILPDALKPLTAETWNLPAAPEAKLSHNLLSTQTELIYFDDFPAISFDDFVLMFALSQLPLEARTSQAVVETANTLFPTRSEPYQIEELAPVPNRFSVNYVDDGELPAPPGGPIAPTLTDVAAVYAALFLPTQLRTAETLATVINALLPNSTLTAADILAVPGQVLPHVPAECDFDRTLSSGAIYRLCAPEGWVPGQSDLVLYTTGYTEVTRPIEIPEEQLQPFSDLPSVTGISVELGFAFATTSFDANGVLNGDAGRPDLLELIDVFEQTYGKPRRIYLSALSLGSLIAAQLAEDSPSLFEGALFVCGPLGDFQSQLDYLLDGRVLFDYFYPNLIPGDLLNIPPEVRQNWVSVYLPRIEAAVAADVDLAIEYLDVAGIAADRQNLEVITEAVTDVIFFHVFGFEDAVARVGGLAGDNQDRVYEGSSNDVLLNQLVQRVSGDPAAFATVEAEYQTTGLISIPTVLLHTTRDPQVPFIQSQLYQDKIQAAGRDELLSLIPSDTDGHCTPTLPAFVLSIAILLLQVEGQELANPEAVLTNPAELTEYRQQLRAYKQRLSN